ncbi:ABC transporter permease [Leifsonia sp. NPDC077715]|uniref:ABC transporter permease n=1 Tax=Leifsonia sp. NPDC077715 TaxID=3155539 RepID=UPI003442B080
MPVWRNVLRHLAGLVITLLVVSALVFLCLYLVPGDPASFLTQGRNVDPATLAAVRAHYGLDQPIVVQYLTWLWGVLHGDLGRSLQFHDSVANLIGSRIPTTVELIVMAGAIIGVVGLLAGIVAAAKNGTTLDKGILIVLSAFSAIPPFVAAIALIFVFAVQLGWFPAFGAGDGFIDSVWHLVLPSIALALTFIALVGRVTRTVMAEQLGREHVEVATSRGVRRGTIVRRHALRNAVGPIATVSGLIVAGMLVLTSVVESSFGLSGFGSLLIQAVQRKDFPVVQAIVLIVVVAFVVVNAVVDLLMPFMDPRAAAGAAAR